MNYRCKKTEDCFAAARTYEYELPVTGAELLTYLGPDGWELRENHKFRRPMFSAKKNGLEIKGILAARIVKVNYTAEGWETEKEQMEAWMKCIRVENRSE